MSSQSLAMSRPTACILKLPQTATAPAAITSLAHACRWGSRPHEANRLDRLGSTSDDSRAYSELRTDYESISPAAVEREKVPHRSK
jgi:hypothetical protein